MPREFPGKKFQNTASKHLLYPTCLVVLVPCLGILLKILMHKYYNCGSLTFAVLLLCFPSDSSYSFLQLSQLIHAYLRL